MLLRTSIVSYYNTLPFLFGLEYYNANTKNDQFSIQRHYPSECAKSLIEGVVDLAIVPVETFATPGLKRVSNYCIGADGVVDSVLLLSNDPIENISTIILDYQSRTSNKLTQILIKHYWKSTPDFIMGTPGFESEIPQNHGAVIIGDRAFDARMKYTHCYDLAEVWKKMTGLPFVFACWAVRAQTDESFVDDLNSALSHGVSSIPTIIEQTNFKGNFDLGDYLTNKISYTFDDQKHLALDLYLSYVNSL